jgi:hypothetical protein
MRKVPYLQWEHIMLDTTIIFAYIQAARESNADPKCTFVKRLIDDLNSNKSTNKSKRHFYISAISISEMYERSTEMKKTEKIVGKMNVSTMTYVSFDTDIAEFMTSNYHPVLGTEKQKAITKELGLPLEDGILAREWITKDLMIIATADYLKCDTVLTLDERTFLPMAKKVDYFCCIAKQDKFNLNDTYIFEYL